MDDSGDVDETRLLDLRLQLVREFGVRHAQAITDTLNAAWTRTMHAPVQAYRLVLAERAVRSTILRSAPTSQPADHDGGSGVAPTARTASSIMG